MEHKFNTEEEAEKKLRDLTSDAEDKLCPYRFGGKGRGCCASYCMAFVVPEVQEHVSNHNDDITRTYEAYEPFCARVFPQ